MPANLARILADRGITTPTPIQRVTLPDSLAGRDVLGRGKTGSGKTVAFALPIVAGLKASGRPRQPKRPRALVLVPTRELATQVAEVLTPLAHALSLRTTVIFGGVGQNPQVRALAQGVDIVIACPGRLEDLLGQRQLTLDAIEITVLDEADHMADLGFLPVVKRLLDATPKRGQRLLFSATLDAGVDVLVKRYLHEPVTHSVDPPAAPVDGMEHHVLTVAPGQKAAVVRELAQGQGRSLLFTRTKHHAKKLAKALTEAGIPALDLQGNLAQKARERNLAAFADGSVRVLVATDIAARGIHVDEIDLVVHVDPPGEHKAYLHRSGRTARAGASGIVVTMVTPAEGDDVRTLMRHAGIKPTITQVVAGHPRLAQLAGPAAAFVTPAPPAPDRPSNGHHSGRGPAPGRSAGGGPRGSSAGSRSGGGGRRRSRQG